VKLILVVLAFFATTAFAQQLAPVAASGSGVPTWLIFIGVAAVAIVGGFFILKKKDPAEAAKLLTALDSAAARIEGSAKSIAAALDSNTYATLASTKRAAVGSPATDAPAAAAPAGKSGTAGAFSLTVTGDPAVDLPAINAAYFAK
jgi:hypothetical protein